jgi:hypothetical protein
VETSPSPRIAVEPDDIEGAAPVRPYATKARKASMKPSGLRGEADR